MHSFARHTLLLMVKQRACSGSPFRDERRNDVVFSSSRRSPKPVRHSEWLRHFSWIVFDSDPRARATFSSRSGPFPRSVTCGPLERALTKCTLLRKHLWTSRMSHDVLTFAMRSPTYDEIFRVKRLFHKNCIISYNRLNGQWILCGDVSSWKYI